MALPYVTPGQLALVENKINDLNEKLTDEDIDSIKAVQSPKDATAGQVLTADGAGKAVYKTPAPSGRVINYNLLKSFSKTGYDTDEYGNKFISVDCDLGYRALVIAVWIREQLRANNVVIPIAEYTVMQQFQAVADDRLRIYLPDETITKHGLTAETVFTGSFAIAYME